MGLLWFVNMCFIYISTLCEEKSILKQVQDDGVFSVTSFGSTTLGSEPINSAIEAISASLLDLTDCAQGSVKKS